MTALRQHILGVVQNALPLGIDGIHVNDMKRGGSLWKVKTQVNAQTAFCFRGRTNMQGRKRCRAGGKRASWAS